MSDSDSIGEQEQKGLTDSVAKKFDFGKIRWDLLPWDVIEKLAEVYTHGSFKYDDENWRHGFEWKRVYRAIIKHAQLALRGEDIDKDSGCFHLAQVMWNAAAALHFLMEGIGEDNRVKNKRLLDPKYVVSPGNIKDIEKQEEFFWEIAKKLIGEREAKQKE